jgi:hypothetical protein
MKFKLFITAILLTLALPASAIFEPIAVGYEVALSDVRLPRNPGGTIAYKPCEECDYKTSRVEPDALWMINGSSVQLEEFRDRMAAVRDPEANTVTVQRDVKTNRIIKISIYLRDSK